MSDDDWGSSSDSDSTLPDIDGEWLGNIIEMGLDYPDTMGVPAVLTVVSAIGHQCMNEAHPVLHAVQDVSLLGVTALFSYAISEMLDVRDTIRSRVVGAVAVAGLFALSYFGTDYIGKWFGDDKPKTEQTAKPIGP